MQCIVACSSAEKHALTKPDGCQHGEIELIYNSSAFFPNLTGALSLLSHPHPEWECQGRATARPTDNCAPTPAGAPSVSAPRQWPRCPPPPPPGPSSARAAAKQKDIHRRLPGLHQCVQQCMLGSAGASENARAHILDELDEAVGRAVHGDAAPHHLLAHVQVDLAGRAAHIPARQRTCPCWTPTTAYMQKSTCMRTPQQLQAAPDVASPRQLQKALKSVLWQAQGAAYTAGIALHRERLCASRGSARARTQSRRPPSRRAR